MENREIAERLIELVGGRGNIQSVAHCATRLRIITVDKEKINMDAVEDLDKVKGSFFNAGQYQIIFGTGLVDKIYDEVQGVLGTGGGPAQNAPVKKEGNAFQRAIRVFGDVFVPIIPALVATGLFMGLRGLITQDTFLGFFGLSAEDISPHFILFTQILTDTAFSFLPALVCWSTFRIFGGNPVIGIVIGLMLVNPALPNAYEVGQQVADPLMFFGVIPVVGYQGSVLPAFITGIVGSYIEKFLKKHIPDAIDLIVTPFLTMLASIILALFVIGPVFHQVELVVLTAVEWILALPGGIGGLIYGSFGQLLGIFGIHHILNFLEISMLSQTGWNFLNPIGSCGNMAQAGAVLAVAVKSRNGKMKQIAYPSALSATLGITEPAVFGVTLRLGRPFIMSMIAGGIGGLVASLLGLKATGMALTAIPGTLLYLNDQLPFYILASLISLAAAFILTWLFGYKEEQEEETREATAEMAREAEGDFAPAPATATGNCDPFIVVEPYTIYAPIGGTVVPSAEIPDPTFAAGVLGEGVGIKADQENVVLAPLNGEISTVTDTKHAVGIISPEGIELLIHVGIDTVDMNGDGFDCFVTEGQAVHAGDPLISFDRGKIAAAGHDDIVVLLVTNSDDYKDLHITTGPTETLRKIIGVEAEAAPDTP